jgi:hypothetical protein
LTGDIAQYATGLRHIEVLFPLADLGRLLPPVPDGKSHQLRGP